MRSSPSSACSPRCSAVRAPVPEADIEARLTREIKFDPDLWIVEVEDRAGRHFLDRVVS